MYGHSPVHRFSKVIFVDRTDQNIATLEKVGTVWYVRSMNPATTGLHNPPYQQETPLGVYVIQEHKPKMYYLRDGSSEIAGFAPWASRFTRGGYIHGVPLNNPKATEKNYIEFSPTLGTTPPFAHVRAQRHLPRQIHLRLGDTPRITGHSD